MEERKVAIFSNPSPRKKKSLDILQLVKNKLSQNTILFDTYSHCWPEIEQIEKYSDAIIVGGDGTLNLFLNTYKNLHLPFSIITAGTGNDFARSLYGIRNIDEQIEIAISGNIIAVDAGICNNKVFHNGLGIGFDGKVVEKMLEGTIFSGQLAYLSKVIPLIFTYKETPINLTINGKQQNIKSLMLTIANGAYCGGGFHVAPMAKINSNQLDICIVKEVSLISRILNLSKIEKGKHLNLPFIEYLNASTIHIKSPYPLPAHLDGEYFKSNEFIINILPNKYLFRTI
jgi:diacylglycerol kinase (ATP)